MDHDKVRELYATAKEAADFLETDPGGHYAPEALDALKAIRDELATYAREHGIWLPGDEAVVVRAGRLHHGEEPDHEPSAQWSEVQFMPDLSTPDDSRLECDWCGHLFSEGGIAEANPNDPEDGRFICNGCAEGQEQADPPDNLSDELERERRYDEGSWWA